MHKFDALAPVAPRLKKLLTMLSSNQPGEVVSTAAAIGRTLAGAGLTWHDLAAALAPTPARPHPRMNNPRSMAEQLRAGATLTAWERDFIAAVLRRMQRGQQLSPKQSATLDKIYGERLGGAR